MILAIFAAAPLVPVLASSPASPAPHVGPHYLKPVSSGPGSGIHANGFGNEDLSYNGGSIDKVPKVYIVYWGWNGNDPMGEASDLEAFFGGVGGGSWSRINTQYYESVRGHITNPTGQLAGTWHDDSSVPPNGVNESALEAEAAKGVAHFGFDQDADYFVATPTGHNSDGFAGNGGGYCAYHWTYTDGNGNTFAWTNMPYMTDAGWLCGQNFVNPGAAGTLDGVTIVAGHEYAEVVTDPFPFSGWVGPGSEIGDECAWINSGPGAARNITLSTGSFAVQSLYSNNDHGCVTSAPLPPHVTVKGIDVSPTPLASPAPASDSSSVQIRLHNDGQGTDTTTVDVWTYATGSPNPERRHVGTTTATVPVGGDAVVSIPWSTLGEVGESRVVVTTSTLWQDDPTGADGSADFILVADPGFGVDLLNNHATEDGVGVGTSWSEGGNYGVYTLLPFWGTTVFGDYEP